MGSLGDGTCRRPVGQHISHYDLHLAQTGLGLPSARERTWWYRQQLAPALPELRQLRRVALVLFCFCRLRPVGRATLVVHVYQRDRDTRDRDILRAERKQTQACREQNARDLCATSLSVCADTAMSLTPDETQLRSIRSYLRDTN